MDLEQVSSSSESERRFDTLVAIHGIATPELRPALTQAANLVAEALGSDKVDIFLHQVQNDSLVALGTSETPMGHKQHALGLHVLPLVNGGRSVAVYLASEPFL